MLSKGQKKRNKNMDRIQITKDTLTALQEAYSILLVAKNREDELTADKKSKLKVLQEIIELNHAVQAIKHVLKLLSTPLDGEEPAPEIKAVFDKYREGQE
jgi:hypothetical protein